MIAPLVKTIEVPCGREEAFTIFVEDMASWWPLAQFSASAKLGRVAGDLVVEPRVGGTIVEIGADGSRHLWGTFKRYEPHAYLSLDFHIGLPAETASLLEVRFTPLGAERTRVELTQSEWERFGRYATNMLNGYPKGWVVIFDGAYRAACGTGRRLTLR